MESCTRGAGTNKWLSAYSENFPKKKANLDPNNYNSKSGLFFKLCWLARALEVATHSTQCLTGRLSVNAASQTILPGGITSFLLQLFYQKAEAQKPWGRRAPSRTALTSLEAQRTATKAEWSHIPHSATHCRYQNTFQHFGIFQHNPRRDTLKALHFVLLASISTSYAAFLKSLPSLRLT